MNNSKSIFGPITGSNTELKPTPEKLASFLDTAAKEGGRELHVNDLLKYRQMLAESEAFDRRPAPGREAQDLRQQMFYGALDHTCFFRRELLFAVVEYKYHLSMLSSLDLNGPSTFIQTAEKEMARLNLKKINDVMRMQRLQEMVAERRSIVADLRRKFELSATELRVIAAYVRENLVLIQTLCAKASAILSNPETGRSKGRQIIEDLKTYFKDRMKEAARRGEVTQKDLERARQDLDLLSKTMAALVKDDAFALMKLYDAVHDHVKKIATDITDLLAALEGKKRGGINDLRALYIKMEHTLVKLISDLQLEQKAPRTPSGTAYDDLIRIKRKELIDHFLESVHSERRAHANRRKAPDRRKNSDPSYAGPERRSGKDRRNTVNRRK